MGRQILGKNNQIFASSLYENKKEIILCTMQSKEQRKCFVFLPLRPCLHAYRHLSNKTGFNLLTAVLEEYPVHQMKRQVPQTFTEKPRQKSMQMDKACMFILAFSTTYIVFLCVYFAITTIYNTIHHKWISL